MNDKSPAGWILQESPLWRSPCDSSRRLFPHPRCFRHLYHHLSGFKPDETKNTKSTCHQKHFSSASSSREATRVCRRVALQFSEASRYSSLWLSSWRSSASSPGSTCFTTSPTSSSASQSSSKSPTDHRHNFFLLYKGSFHKLLSRFCPLRGYPPSPSPLNGKSFCQKTLSGKGGYTLVDRPTQLFYIWIFICWVGGGEPCGHGEFSFRGSSIG